MRAFDSMDPIVRTHSILRDALPTAMEAVGLDESAAALRSADPCDCDSIAALVRAIPDGLPSGRARDAAEDVAFWCEAAVWCAASGDSETSSECAERAVASIGNLWNLLLLH